jgi:hypothetical protein
MTFEWMEWFRSIVGLFFVVVIVEALLPPKNTTIKQILSLLILIGIFTPFFHGESLVVEDDFSLNMDQSYQGSYEDYFSEQVLRETRREISDRIKTLYKEQMGQEPYAIEVKLELNQENQLTVLGVVLIIKENIDSYNKDKICTLVKEQFGAKKVEINKVN